MKERERKIEHADYISLITTGNKQDSLILKKANSRKLSLFKAVVLNLG